MFDHKKSVLSLGLVVMMALQISAVASAKTAKPDAAADFKAPKLALKVDRYDKDQLPRNFRTSIDKLKGKTRDGVMPSTKELKNLNVSASSCFSEKEFENVLLAVPVNANQFYDIDLRQESHGYLDGMAVSWFSYKDWGNDGRTQDIVIHVETDQLNKAFKHQPIQVYTFNDNGNKVGPPIQITASNVRTEEQMVKSHGAKYWRLAIQDHFRPQDSEVDRYLDFYRALPKDAWLHYHCYAGMGRTTLFMIMHDILKSAPQGVSFKDIVKRQALLGKVDLSDIPDSKKNWGRQLYVERYRFTKQFYDYVIHHPNLDMSYVQWAKEHNYESGETDYSGFVWRLDTPNKSELPRNFRTCKSDYTNPIKSKVAKFIKANYQPTRKGLDGLNISGSSEMSINEFKVVVNELKKVARGPIYDMDLRQESHGYFDGQAVSWYGLRDWGNADKKDNVKAILKDERDRLHAAESSKDGVVVAEVVGGKYDKYAKDPKTAEMRYVGIDWNPQICGEKLRRIQEKKQEIAENIFLLSQIPYQTSFEPKPELLYLDKKSLIQDTMADEQLLVIREERGLHVFTGCAHPGIINCLTCVKESFPGEKIYSIFGGMHLKGCGKERLDATIQALKEIKPEIVVPMHCTGIMAIAAVKEHLGTSCILPEAGKVLQI